MYIRVKANPNAKEECLTKVSDDHFEISIKEKPKRGMANKRLLLLIHREFPFAKNVRIVSGYHSQSKIISID